MTRRVRTTAATGIAVLGLAAAAATSGATAAPPADGADPASSWIRRLGIQTSEKHATRPTVTVGRSTVKAANPFLSLLPEPDQSDYAFWRARMAKQSAERARRAADDRSAADVDPFPYDEEEPAGTRGSNDRRANAERIDGFGTGTAEDDAVRILGQLSPVVGEVSSISTDEDQGSIPLATETGIEGSAPEGASTSSVIGDGPFGDTSGDFDFYHLQARAGQQISASTVGSDFDTILVLYDAGGEIVAFDDDAGGNLTSLLQYPVRADGDYFLMVSGFFSVPTDPFDSGSGDGAGEQGSYDLTVETAIPDTDFYAVRLRPGDVLGAMVGGAAVGLVVNTPDGGRRIGSEFDVSAAYPESTPLPGGENSAIGYVAEEAGWYTVSTRQGRGRYDMQLEVYRPGTETAGANRRQNVFLDFDGERLNTGIFGGRGVTTLSPLSAFLAGWGLPRRVEGRLIDRTVRKVGENLRRDLRESGLNDRFSIRLLDSRDHADTFGRPNVSRVVVGGTIEQSGIPTIGIAQSLDVGNYDQEETALVLLDVLSGSTEEWGDASLNFYLRPGSARIRFISQALSNVIAHEIGHYIGNFHVNPGGRVADLMDAGGNFPVLYGAGPDGVGGTADDTDVDFGIDRYDPSEFATGLENTRNVSAWGLTRGR